MRVLSFVIFTATVLLSCRFPAWAQENGASAAPNPDVPNLDEVVNPVAEAGKSAARERTELLRELRAKSPEQLAALARDASHRVRSELLFGPARTKFEVREQNLEATRLESAAAVDRCQEKLRQTHAELEAEATRIRERQAEDSVERNRQLLVLIALYQPSLERLHREIEIHRTYDAQSSGELLQVRRQLGELENRRRADAMRVKQSSEASPLQPAEPQTPPAWLRDDFGAQLGGHENSTSDSSSPSDAPPPDAEEQLKKLLKRKP